jgi:hypothetical protein
MKITSVLIAILVCGNLWSQSLEEAQSHFERYEYALAAKIYKQYAKTNPLPLEDYKRFGYSYFIIGEYQNCLPISDSIINTPDVEPFFYYMNGEVNMGERNYEKASQSYETYQSLDNEFDVSVQLASCKMIPSWEAETYVHFSRFGANTTKADITGPLSSDLDIVYHEIGMDSIGDHVHDENIDNSELILARPLLNIGDHYNTVSIMDSMGYASVSSISFLSEEEVLLTINRPMEEKEMDMAPHIFKGRYIASENKIDNIELWTYSGYEDTSSCAHATVHPNGELIVFSKMGDRTQGSDLYFTKRIGGEWSTPTALTALNTAYDEMYPMFIGDSLLTFSSDGRPGYGGLDIFLADVENNSFGDVQHLKAPINSYKDDFNFAYYSIDSARFTSNRYGGVGDDDMYFIKFSEPYIAPVEDSSDFKDFVANWKTPVIYFDFDKFDLQKAVPDLTALVNFLDVNPHSSIMIEGHTDRRGSTDYNYNLGYKRAQRVKDELTQKGVREGQIKISSKGETDPQVDCSAGCSEEQHAKNRVGLIFLDAK